MRTANACAVVQDEGDDHDSVIALLLQQNAALDKKVAFLSRQLDLERIRRNRDRDVDDMRKKNHLLARERDTLRTLTRRLGTQLAVATRQLTDSPSAQLKEAFDSRGRKIEMLQKQLRERNLSERW